MHYLHLLPLAASLAAAVPKPKGPHPDCCSKNPVLSLLSAHGLTSYCSSFLHIQTVTVEPTVTSTIGALVTTTSTSTITEPQTVVAISTETDVFTSTSTQPGLLTTSVVGTTLHATSTVTSSATVQTTTTVTVTSYGHVGGRAKRDGVTPAALRNFDPTVVSSACQCYVTTPTVTTTTTLLTTSTSTVTEGALTTVSPVVATSTTITTTQITTGAVVAGPVTTITQTTTDIVTDVTVTTTKTTTVVHTSTSTAAGPTFTLVASYSQNCIPFNYLNLFDNVPVSSYDALYQYCADQCAHSACGEIWIADNVGSQDGDYWCLTGSNAPDTSNFDMTWTANEIQCNYQPIGSNGEWFKL